MLAAYLARTLSCLLRQAETDDLVVHVAPPAPNTPTMVITTLELVGKYLARFREVDVTDDRNRAYVTVVCAIHSIDQDLHQVWLSVRQRQAGIYLPGAETEAYVLMKSQKETSMAGINQVKPSGPLLPFQNITTKSGIIGAFNLLKPLNQRFCASQNPWMSGVQHIYPRETLLTGSCMAVEMEITTPAYAFVVGQDPTGELTRIFPSSCQASAKRVVRLQPGELFQFPSLSDPQAGVLELAGSPGTERIYAIAVKTRMLADAFADRMQDIQSLCRPGTNLSGLLPANNFQHPRERIQHWQTYLEQLSLNYPGRLEWREFKFRHIAER